MDGETKVHQQAALQEPPNRLQVCPEGRSVPPNRREPDIPFNHKLNHKRLKGALPLRRFIRKAYEEAADPSHDDLGEEAADSHSTNEGD